MMDGIGRKVAVALSWYFTASQEIALDLLK
jgi:hypothetical protein